MGFKFRDASRIRYYLYLSTTKIDMLYDQINRVTKRSKKKVFSMNAKLVSGSVEASSERVAGCDEKLRAVEDKIEHFQLVGTPGEPKDYFKGTMRMRWGLFDDCGTRPKDEPPLVFFGGFEKTAPLIVGLGGSSKHVVGNEGATNTYSRSSTDTIVKWLYSGLTTGSPPSIPAWRDMHEEDGELSTAIAVALHYLKPPTQDLEFLAKTLWSGTVYGHEQFIGVREAKVVLGTPLYVVLRHHSPDELKFGLDNEW